VTVCTIDSYWHHIITGSVDTTIIVWSLKTYQLERVLMGHKEAITGLELF
jgi:WD40 repeat protein